jgi:hypothetical protein
VANALITPNPPSYQPRLAALLLAAGAIVGLAAPASARSCQTSPTGGGYSSTTGSDGTSWTTSPTGGGYSSTTGSNGVSCNSSPTGSGYFSTTCSGGN